MLLPLKAIISKKIKVDGTSTIYFQYCYTSDKRVLLSTEFAIPAQFWNKKRQCVAKSLPVEFGEAETINKELSRQKKILERLIAKGESVNAINLGVYVKERFSTKLQLEELQSNTEIQLVKKAPDFFTQIDDFIKSKEKKIDPLSLGSLRGMREHLKAYQEHSKKVLTFASLDFNFYCDFVEFLTYDYQLRRKKVPEYGLKTSTIGRTIKKLRMFIKDRVRRKIIAPIDMSEFKIVNEEADTIYLTNDEISTIYYTDLTEYPHLIQYRDLFVLGCLTGLRFSDYTSLQYQDVRKGMLFKKAKKVDTWIIVPLLDEAQIIFDTHFKNRIPKISNPKFNKHIKEIGKLAGLHECITTSFKKGNKDIVEMKPKYKLITSHTARRSFCTNEFLMGTEVSLIMSISGHKTLTDFYKYIRIAKEELAANQIKEIWVNRNNMKALGTTKNIPLPFRQTN